MNAPQRTVSLRAVLYLRVSTVRQAEHDVSIPDQRRQGEAYCQSRGYQLVETYVEAGASATNDRRPEFQKMIEAGTSKPSSFDIVIVHSFSRFFRDHFELEFYVRRLAQNGVRLVSITQEMGDDPMHVMMRQIMALFDEYQSKENAKHVLRALKENARQGFWNGSLPPIGYRVVAAEQRGSKTKKKLEIDPLHADTVRLIYQLFLEGDGACGPMGVKKIVSHLNTHRIFTRDGGRWGVGQVHRILTRRTYVGAHEFNKRSKAKELKPISEVVTVPVPPIIDQVTFDAVQAHLRARNPKVTPARVVSGPTLLTGICFCADCGGAMTLRTGKGGRYRYYTCSIKARQGETGCKGRSIPMEKLDDLVARHLEDRLLNAERLEEILASLLDRRQERTERRREHIAELNKRAAETELRLKRLYDAIEVSPELVDGTTATDRWAQPFDAPLTHVFQMQGEIANKVAQALQVALTPATQQAVEARPTADLAAYDSYLRGVAIGRSGNSPQVLRQAIAAIRDAVTRDSAFALAWSRLATDYSLLYFNGKPLRAVADSSDRAFARALALAPDLPDAHAARGAYFALVLHDQVRGLAEAKAGLALAPANTTLLITVASGEAAAGLFDSAAATAARAAALDPRDASVFRRVASIAMDRRRSVEAQAAAERALALQPGNLPTIDGLACILLQQGDLAGARRMVERESATGEPTATVAYLGNYYDLGWVLDSALSARLLATRPDAFYADTGTWAFVLAQQYGFAGDRARQRAYADTARAAFSGELAVATEPDPQRHMFLGLALAYLGRDAEAVKEGERAIAIASAGPGGRHDPYFDHQLARVYLAAGQPERALDMLEILLAEPYFVTPAWLRIDPNFAPLRGNPRFERLAAGSGAPIA